MRSATAAAAAAEELDGEDDCGDDCAICLEPLSLGKVQTLPCNHVYHAACVEKLRSAGISQACPMCRALLPPGPEQLFEDALRRSTFVRSFVHTLHCMSFAR